MQRRDRECYAAPNRTEAWLCGEAERAKGQQRQRADLLQTPTAVTVSAAMVSMIAASTVPMT